MSESSPTANYSRDEAAASGTTLRGFDLPRPTGGTSQQLPPGKKPKYAKLDSQLSEVAEAAEQGHDRSPEFGFLAHPDARSSVGVSIYYEGGAHGLAARLSQLPGVLVANEADGVIEAYVPVLHLAALNGYPDILRVSPIVPPQPLVTSEGTTEHNSPNWNSFGFTGAGVKVGIIDVGFVGYSSLIGSELPTPAAVRCYVAVGAFTSNINNCQTDTDHGTAVAEAVVDIAPSVQIYLANPFSFSDLLTTTQWMISQGVQVINHSVGWIWAGPGDGTSPFSDSPLLAVDAAVNGGAVWANSAGNSGEATWTGPFTDTDSDGRMQFSGTFDDNGVVLQAGETFIVQLRWEDPWGGAVRDLDLYLYNSDLTTIVASSIDEQSGSPGHIPFELFQIVVPSTGVYFLVVDRFAGTVPAWVDVQSFSQQDLEFFVPSNSIANPAESSNAGMLAVGAANWQTTSTIESFSSRGPTRDNRIKPDIVGADRGNSLTYGPGGFAGTSQASPHVAGLAGILRQGYPTQTPAQIAALLKAWALERGTPGPDNTWGSGFAFLQTIEGKAVFTQSPDGGTAGASFPLQPVVAMRDAANNPLSGDNATVITLSLLNSGGATLSCAGGLSKTVVSGVATFSGCQINNPGSGYQLVATPSCFCVTPPASPPFNVSPGATKLGFTQQPNGGISGVAFPIQPIVAVQDADSVTVAGDSTTQVTLSLIPIVSATASAGSPPPDGAGPQMAPGTLIRLEASPGDAFTSVGPPSLPSLNSTAANTATFVVNYTGFSAEAQAAFQAAVDIWSQLIVSPVPIVINATWEDTGSPSNLGMAGPFSLYRDFPGAPQIGTWYAVALANARGGLDLSPSDPDIVASFNSARSDWYFGTDGNTPAGQYDLMSVVVHEIGHGLGFLDSMAYSSGTGSWGYGTGFPVAYDRHVVNGADQALVTAFVNPSVALGSQLTSANLFFAGANAVAANGASKPKLYAPGTWASGSSVAHLDEATFPPANPNSLMTPFLNSAESIHSPGAVGLAILKDAGWVLASDSSAALSCAGGLTKTAVNGVVAFSGCSITEPGLYVLHATSSPTLTPASTGAFVITGLATQLVFSQQLSNGITGTPLATQPVVLVQDANGATVASDSSTQVTLALAGGAGTLTCTGGLTKTVVNGVATFAGCSVETGGTFTLHATSTPALTPADSNSFVITGPPNKLAFSQQPSNGETGTSLPVQPVVAVQDSSNNTVVTDSSTIVTLSLIGVGTLTCDGGLSKAAANGVAPFAGCEVDAVGTFTIHATSSPSLTAADSNAFDVTASGGTVWYFAEGFTGNGWETYLYLLNATTAPANVSVTYFRASGTPVVKNIIIPGESRRTLFANDVAEGPGSGEAFGITITSDQPITAQQSLIDTAGALAHGSVGSQVLSQTWYFAEGFTGNGWLTFISATNPGATTANVSLTYHKTDGTSVTRNASVGPQSRFTFAGHDDPNLPGSTGVGPGQAFAVSISSDQPIVAQEVLIDTVGLLAHGTIGVTSAGTAWYFAEGFTGDSWLTFLSVGNLNAGPAQVTATYNVLGQPPVSRTITVGPGSRGTFAGHEVPTGVGPGQAFGVTITSDVPVVVQEVLIDPKPGVALAHAVMGASALSSEFTFGGGTSEAGWLTFVSATNPGASAVTVSATYYFEGGFAPITRTVSLDANSRTTFASFDSLTGAPAGRQYGVKVTSSAPIISQQVAIDVVRYLAYSAAGTPGP